MTQLRISMRVRAVAGFVGLAMLASTVTAIAEPPDVAGGEGLPALQKEKSVPVTDVEVRPLPDMSAKNAPVAKAAWPAAGAAEVALPETGGAAAAPAKAGKLPVLLTRTPATDTRTKAPVAHGKGKVKVEVLDQKKSAAVGVNGVLVRVSRVDGDLGGTLSVSLDYKGFANAFGGDYAHRLTMSAVPDCVLSTPDRAECAATTPLRSTNAASRHQLTGEVTLGDAKSMLVAVTAAASSGSGDFTATSLAPTGSWSVGGSGGDFSYNYPLRLPPALGGSAPSVAFGYSSGAVDGRTSTTNNQASWLGDGWDLSVPNIERRYKACSDDGQTTSNDLCWATDNLTLTLGGRSSELVKGADGVWHPKQDDGSRIKRLTGAANGAKDGEYWEVTTTDGTRYIFGQYRLPGWAEGRTDTRSVWTVPVFGNNAGEPCYKTATFADNWCQQGYRWNLDLVIDPHGNATTYFYEREGNYYNRNGTTPWLYIRGGWLAQINYGLRSDDLFATPPASIVFQTQERCVPGGTVTCAANQLTKDTASHWPDVPFDQICNINENCVDRTAATFFTRKRLSRVYTSVWTGTETKTVDQWDLTHSFPPVDGAAPSMWLNSIKHTGLVGTTPKELPATTFSPVGKPNRVDSDVDHGRPPIIRNRISSIVNETGALTQVGYTEPDCQAGVRMPTTPETNTLRCFPQWWTPPGAFEDVFEYFHKYVVTAVTDDPRTGGAAQQQLQTRYDYLGDAAWHFDNNDLAKPEKRTWSEWRGYSRVIVTKGDINAKTTVTETNYMRGMDGDRLPNNGTRDVWEGMPGTDTPPLEDHEVLQGEVREVRQFSGRSIASAVVYDPWISAATAVNGEKKAFLSGIGSERGRTLLKGGTWRRTQTNTTYHPAQGMPTQVEDLGDLAVTGDETCVATDYARNETAWLLTYPKSVRTIYGDCTTHVGPGGNMREVRSSYDNQSWGAAPTTGKLTQLQELDRWDENGQTWVTTARSTYDAYGRSTEVLDAKNNKTTTAYTPAAGAQPSEVKTTNALNQVATNTFEPAWGLPTKTVAPSGATTYLQYDALGRLTHGWKPGHRPDFNDKPDVVFEYAVNQNSASVVTTKLWQDSLAYRISYAFYDGLGREIQTQAPATGSLGGRILTDTFYDTRGLAHKTFAPYWNNQAPANTLAGIAADNMVPRRTVTTYDQLERPTSEVLYSLDTEKWRTTNTYEGDRVHTRPPAGGIATTTISDAQGRVTELRQHQVATMDGGFDSTRYTYTKQGDLNTITDPAGNTWTYGYDLRGRKISADDPDRGHTDYRYNELGQLTSTTDARGKTLAYSYDELGRKTGMFDSTTAGTKLAEWTFDTVRPGLPAASTRFDNGNAYTTRTTAYDEADRPLATEIVIPPVENELGRTYQFTTDYTITGKVFSVALPAAGGLTKEGLYTFYNDHGLPNGTFGTHGSNDSTSYVSSTSYSSYGEPLSLMLNNEDSTANVNVNYGYDEASRRLNRISSYRETSTGYKPVTTLQYKHDPAGNITQLTDAPGEVASDTQCFTYDYARRLTRAWTPANHDCTTPPSAPAMGGAAPYWLDWTFDNIGNRRTETSHTTTGDTTRTFTYPAANAPRPHAVQSITVDTPTTDRTDTYTYDPTGNTETRTQGDQTQTLTYNNEGRLTTATEPNGDASNYLYDADGNRLLKREKNATTLYLPGTELSRDATTGVVTGTRYYTHNGTTVATRTPTALTWSVPDHHGTVNTTITGDATQATKRYQDPYGNPRGTAPTTWPTTRGYLNAPTDTTGYTHLGARDYDPTTGRFTTVDPILDPNDPQQHNAYTYSANNPTTFTDPDGEKYFPDDSGGSVDSGACRDGNCYGSTVPSEGPGSPTIHPKNYTTKHNAVSIAAVDKILWQAEELGFKVKRIQRDVYIPGAAKRCADSDWNVIAGCIGYGFADIVLTVEKCTDKGTCYDQLYVWEVKSLGQDRQSRARKEAEWYAMHLHNIAGEEEAAAASIGWDIGGPYKDVAGFSKTSYWGGTDGAIIYGDDDYDTVRRHVAALQERGELANFNAKSPKWEEWNQASRPTSGAGGAPAVPQPPPVAPPIVVLPRIPAFPR